MLHFKAVPRQALDAPAANGGSAGAAPVLVFDPAPGRAAMLERALASIEFRGAPLQAQLPLAGSEPVRLVARPPEDLPALLRTARQLEQRARQDAGERTLLWRCDCGARFLVTTLPGHQTTALCERCAKQYEIPPAAPQPTGVELDAAQALGEVNALRYELAGFFREAMARGWIVVAERDTASARPESC